MTEPAVTPSTATPTLRVRWRHAFSRAATATARGVGHPLAFLAAVAAVAGWGLAGVSTGFSEGWQLWINTATTILTFLMVILLQNSQNRQSEAVQLKLDELLRAVEGARVSLVELEKLDDEELAHVRAVFERLGQWARRAEGGRSGAAAAGKAEP